MAKVWNEKLSNLSEKLDDLSKKAAEAADDAKTYHELLQDVIDEKISTAKGNVAAMQENARLAGEEHNLSSCHFLHTPLSGTAAHTVLPGGLLRRQNILRGCRLKSTNSRAILLAYASVSAAGRASGSASLPKRASYSFSAFATSRIDSSASTIRSAAAS